jgi:hypothetical protein
VQGCTGLTLLSGSEAAEALSARLMAFVAAATLIDVLLIEVAAA